MLQYLHCPRGHILKIWELGRLLHLQPLHMIQLSTVIPSQSLALLTTLHSATATYPCHLPIIPADFWYLLPLADEICLAKAATGPPQDCARPPWCHARHCRGLTKDQQLPHQDQEENGQGQMGEIGMGRRKWVGEVETRWPQQIRSSVCLWL